MSSPLFQPPEPTDLVERLIRLAAAANPYALYCPKDDEELEIHLHGGAECPHCGEEFEVKKGGRLVPTSGLDGWAATWPNTLPSHWASPLMPKANQALVLLTEGGFSLDKDLNPVTDLTYVVSVHGTEQQIPLSIVQPNDILSYRAEHADALSGGMIFGGWLDGSVCYLDLSKNFHALPEAMTFAQANEQKAIWDNANQFALPVMQTVPTDSLHEAV